MIIHYKELNEILLGKKIDLKYSEEFSFVPLKIYHNNKFKDCVFQTPKLFLPYGKQRLDNGKYVIDLSFQNKDNDLDNKIFLKILKKIFHTIKETYKDLAFKTAMEKIKDVAFSSISPNPDDPIILHFKYTNLH